MLNLRYITLAYVFFICISYNLEWFYLAGSFAYADLLLPMLLLAVLHEKRVILDPVSFLLFGLAVLTCASSLYAVSSGSFDDFNVGYVFRALYFFGLYVLLFNSSVSTEDVIKAISLSLFFSLLLCFYIWSTNPRYFAFSSMPMLHVMESPTGLVVNRNESGLSASLLYAMSLYGIAYGKLFSKPVNFLLFIVSLLAVAFSFSKGAWLLALIASSLIMLYRYRLAKSFICLFMALTLFSLFPLSDLVFLDAVISRFANSGETNAYRLAYILDSASIGANNLILGIGPGNYKEYTIDNGYTITIDPHNSYLQSFAEKGIFGLIFVVALYCISLVKSFFNAKREEIYIVVFMLIGMLMADGLQSGLSLTMKIFYILSALSMRSGLYARS